MSRNFIRIQVLDDDSPRKIEVQRYSDGRMKTTPPRLNGLHFRRRTFRELMDPFVWNYVIDNGLEGVKKVEDDVSSDDNESSVFPPPPPSVAITPVKTSATTVDDSTKYPHLSRALGDEDGYFDPADPGGEAYLCGLLQEINHLLSTKYELNIQVYLYPPTNPYHMSDC